MKKTQLISALLLTALASLASGVHAGQASEEAKLHFQAIANGDLPMLMRSYADNAQLNWVGGPLDGIYSGAGSIGSIWEKFTKSQGTLKVGIAKLEESANPKGSTVTANVQFEGKQAIKVRYVLNYRDNKIVGETWQIDPQLVVSAY